MKKAEALQKQKKEDDNLVKLLQDEENFYKKSKKSKQEEQPKQQISFIQEDGVIAQSKPVWEDDEEIEVDISAVARLRKLRKNDEETTISGKEYQNRLQEFYNNKLYQNEFFRWGKQSNNQEYTQEETQFSLPDLINTDYQYFESHKNNEIQPGVLNIQKIGRTLQKDKHNAVVQKLDFYQNANVFLSCGMDKMLKIFSVNENEKFSKNRIHLLKKVYTEDFPLTQAQFLNSQNQVLAAGCRKNLLCYDLVKDKIQKISSNFFTQRFKKQIDNFAVSKKDDFIALWDTNGYIYILSGKTKQYLFEFKIANGNVLSAVFSPDSKYLYASSNKGKIFQYDIHTRKIFAVFSDPGSLSASFLACSPSHLISASSSSFLNVFQPGNHEVIKSLDNLTTPLTGCEFSPSFQLATFYSEKIPNSIRIVGFPELQVVKNWPNVQTKMGHVTTTAWGGAGMLAIGNKHGDIEMYQIGKE